MNAMHAAKHDDSKINKNIYKFTCSLVIVIVMEST